MSNYWERKDVFIAYHLDNGGDLSKGSYLQALELKNALEKMGFKCYMKEQQDGDDIDMMHKIRASDCFILVANKYILDKCAEIEISGGEKRLELTVNSCPHLYDEINHFLSIRRKNTTRSIEHRQFYACDKDLKDDEIADLHPLFADIEALRSISAICEWVEKHQLKLEKELQERRGILKHSKDLQEPSSFNLTVKETAIDKEKTYKDMYNIGITYKDKQDYDKTFKIFDCLATLGYAAAQWSLGYCYEYGRGVEKDEKQAVELYRKAADQGDARAQWSLGICYYYGIGVEKDEKQAVYWYRKAADQGDAYAQCNLGVCYKYGKGVDKDEEQAVYWYRKSAEQGQARAQCNLGVCYYNGIGVEKDEKQAVYWYRKAADQGDADAQNSLGVCYYNGDGVEKDLDKAFKYLSKSAKQGYARAQCNLGEYYEDVEKDYKKAYEWYKKAYDNGFEDAKEYMERVEKLINK